MLDTRLRRRRNILRPKLLPRWDYDQRGNMINKQIDITNYGKWLEEDNSVNSITVSLSYSLLCLGRWFSDRDKWWYSSHLKQSMARPVRTQGSTQRVGAFQRNGIFKLVKVVFFWESLEISWNALGLPLTHYQRSCQQIKTGFVGSFFLFFCGGWSIWILSL